MIICIHEYVYIHIQYYTILYVCIIYTYGTAPPRSCFQRLVSVLIFACSIMNSVAPCDDFILPTNMDPAG